MRVCIARYGNHASVFVRVCKHTHTHMHDHFLCHVNWNNV